MNIFKKWLRKREIRREIDSLRCGLFNHRFRTIKVDYLDRIQELKRELNELD